MTSLYIGVAALIAVLFLAWRLVAAYNAPKTEAEKTAQKETQAKQEAQRQAHRQEVLDKRIEARENRRGWRRRRGQTQPVPSVKPDPVVK